MYACELHGYAIVCTDRWSILSHRKFCKINTILTNRAIDITTNHICREKEDIIPASDKVKAQSVELGEAQS